MVGRRLEVGAGHHAFGHAIDQQVVDLGRDEDAARQRRAIQRAALVVEQHLAPAFRQLAGDDALELGALAGGIAATRARQRARSVRRGGRRRASRQHVGRNLERRRRPAELLARRGSVFRIQLARCGRRAGPAAARCRLRDDRAARDQRRPRVGLGGARSPPTRLRGRGRRPRRRASRRRESARRRPR